MAEEEEKPTQKIKINPDYTWQNYQHRPVKEALQALFLNNQKVFNIMNNTNPKIKPAVITDNATSDEFVFMMGEI
jgi:hypothetical protein